MTKFPDLFSALAMKFEPHEVKERTQGGRKLSYITARTALNRMDDVLGPESWWDEYTPHENSVLCKLTIRLPDGTTLTKCDAGGYAGMADSGDDDKSGYSDAFKRACVKFGVGRYLYNDGVPAFIREILEPPAKAATPRVEPKAKPADPDSRPFGEYAEAAAKAADVDFWELLDDVIENLSEDGRIPTKLRDRDQKVRDVSDYYQHNRGTVQAMVKGLVKDYRKRAAAEGNGVR